MEQERRLSPSFLLAAAVAIVPAIAGVAVMKTEIAELKAEQKESEARITEQIRQVDLNSANRRVDGHEEMLRLHDLQAQQIMQNREDLKDHIRASSK